MTSLEFRRTGDPWIDQGTAELWSFFATYADKSYLENDFAELRIGKVRVTLRSDSLTLDGPAKGTHKLLDGSLERLGQTVWRETKKGKMWWSGVALFFFKQQIRGPKGFLVTLDQLKRKSRKGTCDFCGRVGVNVLEARASEHPLLVKSEKMSSFYSQLRGVFTICIYCTFASWFATRAIFFNLNLRSGVLNSFFFDAPDLLRLDRLQQGLSRHRAEAEPYRNFKIELVKALEYPLENFVGFLLTAYKEMTMKKPLFQGVTVHIFSSRLDKRKVSFMRYYTVPNLPRLLDFLALMEWQSATRQHNALEDVMSKFYFVYAGGIDTVVREELARRFLTLSEIADVVEEFLIRRVLSEEGELSGFEIISFYQLISKYEREVLGLDYRILNAARSLGDILGTIAAEKDDKSILYALRGLRSIEDYYAYLHQFVTRHIDSLEGKESMKPTIDTITSEIDEKNWRNHRSLVGIYAVLKYIDQRRKKKTTEVT